LQLVPSTVTVSGSRLEFDALLAVAKRNSTSVGWHCAIVTKKPVLRPAYELLPALELPRLLYSVLVLLSNKVLGDWLV